MPMLSRIKKGIMKSCLLVVAMLIAVTLIITGCAGTQTPIPNDLKDVVITLERTVCFGVCPEYKLSIYGDGTVIYEGIRFVRIEGTVETTISEDKIQQLVFEFQRIDYFSLEDSYEEHNATDMPSAITSYMVNGKKKTVRHYHGDFSAPKQLTELENKIDEIIGSDKWGNLYLR